MKKSMIGVWRYRYPHPDYVLKEEVDFVIEKVIIRYPSDDNYIREKVDEIQKYMKELKSR